MDLGELFKEGNFVAVAMQGSRQSWQTYAALGLIGKTEEAIAGLADFPQPEARFYLGVAHWLGGEEEPALEILENNPLPHAQNLVTLIRKPQIQVLAQLPWTRRPPHDLLTASARDRKFKVRNISSHPDDLPSRPYADIHRFYDSHSPPDFYICAMVEWHLIPPNLPQLPCPIFGQTSDYDLHVQTVYPWLQVFDELLVTDHTEWQDVRRLVQVPVVTFPKVFGVADELPPLDHRERTIDVFHSGSILHPYFNKLQVLKEVLSIPDIKPLFIDGFISQEEYYDKLAQSKVCVNYLRHPGATSTRALEALSMGCVALVQEGNVLSLFMGAQEGLLTYKSGEGDLAATIRRVIEHWPEFEENSRRGAALIRRDFALSRAASQYLRFLTYLAAKPRPARPLTGTSGLRQKRSILWKGWLPEKRSKFRSILLYNLCRWLPKIKQETSTHLSIDLMREIILNHALRTLESAHSLTASKLRDHILSLIKQVVGYLLAVGRRVFLRQYYFLLGKRLLLPQIFKKYRTSLERFPDSLVLRFNLIRAMLHLGRPQEVTEALQLLEETLHAPSSRWQIDVLEDVYPYDFCSDFFNYRKYLDLVTQHLREGTPVQEELLRLILASLHYYLGHYSAGPAHFAQAASLDPDFPFYQMAYARRLIEQGERGDYEKAGELLTRLAESSILFQEAFELLKYLDSQQLYTSPRLAELTAMIDMAKCSLKRYEDLKAIPLQPRSPD